MKKHTYRIILMALLLQYCVPVSEPPQNLLGAYIARPGSAQPGPEAVPIYLTDQLFDSSGPRALAHDEKIVLQNDMYERYSMGFYDPFEQVRIVQEFSELDLEMQEEGVTFDEVQTEFVSEIEDKLSEFPPEILWKLRYVAAGSILVSHEMKLQPVFEAEGMDVNRIDRSIERMRHVYNIVSDEIERRK